MERKNLWAPWRFKYIQALAVKHKCFICHNLKNPQEDSQNFVLWRTKNCLVMFNRFPYNNGHLLIAPNKHIATLEQASVEEMTELMILVRDCQVLLNNTIKPHGFNVGVNIGRCAGAGLPDHIHIHIVPRWDGDTNYMHTCGDTDVISQSMTELYEILTEKSKELSLPNADIKDGGLAK